MNNTRAVLYIGERSRTTIFMLCCGRVTEEEPARRRPREEGRQDWRCQPLEERPRRRAKSDLAGRRRGSLGQGEAEEDLAPCAPSLAGATGLDAAGGLKHESRARRAARAVLVLSDRIPGESLSRPPVTTWYGSGW